MSERIEQIEIIEGTNDLTIFYNGPAEFLAQRVATQLKLVPQFKALFNDNIDGYRRMDYSERSLPVCRIYNNDFLKEFDSWYITGDLIVDVIFPPNIRRAETQDFQDTISSALLQQFRRPEFFVLMESLVPGLNELGKTFSVDKSMGFEFGDNVVPLTQMRVNFRINLEQWDLYLERTNRTKDSPFLETLANLERIVAVIQGLNNDSEVEVTLGTDQKV